MSEPDERLPRAGTGEPASEHDPEAAEAYAESVPIDPTPEQIDRYLEIEGDRPLSERVNPGEDRPDGEAGP